VCDQNVTMWMDVEASAEQLWEQHGAHPRMRWRTGSTGAQFGFDGAYADAQHSAKPPWVVLQEYADAFGKGDDDLAVRDPRQHVGLQVHRGLSHILCATTGAQARGPP
jgi:hypothetical protein